MKTFSRFRTRQFAWDLAGVVFFWAMLGGGAFAWQRQVAPFHGSKPLGERSSLEEVDFIGMRSAVESRAAIVDARSRDRYDAGHVQTAVALPRIDFERELAKLSPELNRSRLVIVYCENVECEDAEMVARRLRALGFTRVGIYRGGWEEWRENAASTP